jgi:hypothetical protein
MAGSFRWEGKTATVEIVNERLRQGMPYPRAVRGLDFDDDFSAHAPYLGGPELLGDQSVYLRSARHRVRGLGEVIADVPKRVPGVVKFEIFALRQWLSVGKLPVGVVALLVGWFGTRWWRRESRDDLVFLLGLGALQSAVPVGILYLWDRFAFPIIPHALPWVAAGLLKICSEGLRWVDRRRGASETGAASRWTPAVSVLTAMSICGATVRRAGSLDDFTQAMDMGPKEAGLWIRSQPHRAGRARPIVMGAGAIVPYYAGAVLAYLPAIDDETVSLRFVHWTSPDYIALRTRETSQEPYFSRWLEKGIPDDCADPVLRVQTDRGMVRVWRWHC